MSFLVLTSSNQSHNNDILIEHPGSFPNLSTNNFNYVSEILSSILDAYNSSGYFPQLYQPSLQDLETDDYSSPIFKDHIEYIDDQNYSTYFKPLKKNKQLTIIARYFRRGF